MIGGLRMRLSEKEMARRGPQVQELLRPISPWPSGPAWARLSLCTSQIIIGTHDGSRPTTSYYRDWRFSVGARRHHAMYFEVWKVESNDKYVLNQAYLNVYVRTEFGEKEIVCLHCDPSLALQEAHSKYKRGPHIHMSMA